MLLLSAFVWEKFQPYCEDGHRRMEDPLDEILDGRRLEQQQ